MSQSGRGVLTGIATGESFILPLTRPAPDSDSTPEPTPEVSSRHEPAGGEAGGDYGLGTYILALATAAGGGRPAAPAPETSAAASPV